MAYVQPSRTSLWHQTVELPQRHALREDLETEAVIIGGGMAGLNIADQLRRRGIRAPILEAGRIAGRQTGNTTAKITSQHGLIYAKLAESLGEEGARQYAQANQEALAEYRRIIQEEEIDCDFQELPAYLYALEDAAPLKAEAEAAGALGLPAQFVTETELPFEVAGAVRFDGQAQFHPLKYVKAISERLEIYEASPVLSVVGGSVQTPHGRVSAKHVIFAAHFPFVNVPGWYFLRMHQERSYVLALKESWRPRGMYIGAETGRLSFREAEGLLLLGGGGHRTGENSAGGRYEALRQAARRFFPKAEEAAAWSAQDCVTLDGVPYIGAYADNQLQWYVATGFAKWGMTTAMAAAKLISGLIGGDPPPWAPVFSPQRFRLSASAKNLATETAQAFKGLGRENLTLPQAALDALPTGHGGIVEVEGRKRGVYKEPSGVCHVVNPRCPHLGCQLEWNPDELSWDCPCHGSRFDFDGRLLDGPAQKELMP